MDAIVNRNIYERTNDVKRMLTSGQLAQAIIKEVKRQFAKQESGTNIFGLLPARAATSMRYDRGARTAMIWNEGGKEERIDLPLEDGWRRLDGNPFGVPNGEPSGHDDPEALYLYRYQDRSFNGPVGLSRDWSGGGRRYIDAKDGWSIVLGVALVGREATAPLVEIPKERLTSVADPQQLRQDAAQLRDVAENLQERFKGCDQALTEVVKPMFEKAARFIEVAEAIEQARK